jgi:hypothetical protein
MMIVVVLACVLAAVCAQKTLAPEPPKAQSSLCAPTCNGQAAATLTTLRFNQGVFVDTGTRQLLDSFCDEFPMIETFEFIAGHIDGRLPRSFAKCTNLRTLHFNGASFISSFQVRADALPELPASIRSFSIARAPAIDFDSIGIPTSYGRLSNLRTLRIDNTEFFNRTYSGAPGAALPSQLAKLTLLTEFRLLGVRTSVPAALAALSSLTWLELDEIYGLPANWRMPQLERLDVRCRSFDSRVSAVTLDSFVDLPNMTHLLLDHCPVRGTLPTALAGKELHHLKIATAGLTGTIPGEWSTRFKNLYDVNLINNVLRGPIPDWDDLSLCLIEFDDPKSPQDRSRDNCLCVPPDSKVAGDCGLKITDKATNKTAGVPQCPRTCPAVAPSVSVPPIQSSVGTLPVSSAVALRVTPLLMLSLAAI